ncbi:hypothetical protein E8E12_005488 [Didymella heteroderae]|uniref:Uncharacterized protein n=1 Tax=Didymella heteroderae TaxID=1769908 RepID=A0A9P5BXY0_9PLEO|nr:hypothetical protein E8E12_005488 [Didymella heteroderae]
MAGYGNRTAPDYTADTLTEEHSNTRLGLTDSHSPPTYGAGFGNKRASQPSITPSSSADKSVAPEDGADSPLRFNSQDWHGSAPYSNAHTYGSASTAGAGWGNKTGSFGDDGGEHKDSTLGKVMEKVGGVLHSSGLVKKGHAKREAGPSGGDPDAPVAN